MAEVNFLRDDLRRILDLLPKESIEMFLEYRDKHGFDEQAAKDKAIWEMREGVKPKTEWITHQDPENADKYRQAAKDGYDRDGEIEIDDGEVVSKGEDAGAYVQAWVWVADEEAGIETVEEGQG